MENSWIEVPSSSDLSREQLNVYEASLNSNMMINGAAGSGKTILAIYRAKQLEKEGKKVLFLVYTKILLKFTKLAADQFGLKNVDIMTIQDLSFKTFNRRIFKHDELTDKQIKWMIDVCSGYDHVIVDEGQDFNLDIYSKIYKKLGNVHTVCCDNKQAIFEVDFDKEKIKDLYDPMNENILKFTYRNPINILKLSLHYYKSKYSAIPASEVNIKVYNKTEGKVYIIDTKNEMETVASLIKNRGKNTTGILLPTNEAVRHFYNGLSEKGIKDLETKFSIGKAWENNIDFGNTAPKVMTFWSSKGVQFDTVIIPWMSKNMENKFLYNEQTLETRALYVAMTRTKKNLYFTRLENHSFPYEQDLHSDFYVVRNKDEKPEPDIDDIFQF